MLTCDLLLLSEEASIRNSHPHFLQACNNVKKAIKGNMTNTFKEILSMPLTTLTASKAFWEFLEFLRTRLLSNSRVLSMPTAIEAFLVTLVYKVASEPEFLSLAANCLAVFWATTDKNGANLNDVAKNASVLIDRCLKTDLTQGDMVSELKDTPGATEETGNQKGDLTVREKIEELVMDRSKRILFPQNLKFGYLSTKVVPVMVNILTQMLHDIDTESMSVDIEPIVSLIRKCNEIEQEQVAYSDELSGMRSSLRLATVQLAKAVMKAFAGSYYDIYPILFDETNWKAEELTWLTVIMELLIEHFDDFPRNYHQGVVFEEPNMLNAIPKLLVWSPKHQVDTSTSQLLKSKKLSQNTPRLSDTSLTSDWIDQSTKKASPETVYAFRKLCMRCE